MATDVNKNSRKRKSASDLIFEVDEGDFSPPVTPELPKEIIQTSSCGTDSSKEIFEVNNIPQDNNDSISKCKIFGPKEDAKIGREDGLIIENPKSDADLSYMDMDVANSPPSQTNTEKPLVSVLFRDKETALRVGGKVKNYIKNIVNYEYNVESRVICSDISIEFWDELNNFSQESQVDQAEKLDLFVVDTTPSKKHEFLPRYTPTNKCKTIGEAEKAENTEKNCRPTQTCFNCDGNHSMRDCTETRNMRKIALARSRFKAQQKTIRYHIDDDVKYKHLTPGKISEELRRALDVRKHELPPYIYRMRNLGYPPGWLQEAMISNAKLELFDFEGCAVNDEGEIASGKIDSSKIIEYPGFNAPLDKDYKDVVFKIHYFCFVEVEHGHAKELNHKFNFNETKIMDFEHNLNKRMTLEMLHINADENNINEYKYFNCPPYNEKHSKKCMVEYIEQTSEQTIIKNDVPKKITESDSNSQESQDTDRRRSESPTLNDLELRKRQLLAELEEGININSPSSANDTSISSNPLSKDIIESPSVVSSSFGTPILKSATPYMQLPGGDKFSKGICPVINFENLPDSTGKYEQMTEVINKVRKTVKNTKS